MTLHTRITWERSSASWHVVVTVGQSFREGWVKGSHENANRMASKFTDKFVEAETREVVS